MVFAGAWAGIRNCYCLHRVLVSHSYALWDCRCGSRKISVCHLLVSSQGKSGALSPRSRLVYSFFSIHRGQVLIHWDRCLRRDQTRFSLQFHRRQGLRLLRSLPLLRPALQSLSADVAELTFYPRREVAREFQKCCSNSTNYDCWSWSLGRY